MTFSVNRLTTVVQCDTLLTAKQRERTGLANRLSNIQFQITNWDETADPAAELATTQSLITGLTPIIDAMADGDDKRRNQNILNRYETRANNLIGKVENHGVLALLEKEQDRDTVTGDIAVVDALIAAVTIRRAEILAGG